MNDLIERYIHDVTKRLPETSRAEVGKELRANIDDMLPPNPTNEDIKKVLITLGEPRVLASKYRGKQRYLISPEWMDEYLQVLKIVLIVVGSLGFFSALITHILYPSATTAIGIFAEVVSSVFSEVCSNLFSGFAVVTLVFVAIDYFKVNSKRGPWNPDNLPKLPKPTDTKISKVGSLIGLMMALILGSFFIFLLFENQRYVGWFEWEGGVRVIYPIFTDAVCQLFAPLFIVSFLLAIGDSIIKYYYGKWNLVTATSHTIYQILSVALVLTFFRQPNLMNPAFLLHAQSVFGVEAEFIQLGITQSINGFTVFLCIVVMIDLITTWVKTLRHSGKIEAIK
ncbi:MAG: hypothetical protein NTV44_02830 [Firmicutes bacterium]|nr:hypothetical protein [Bacillota bacterium]